MSGFMIGVGVLLITAVVLTGFLPCSDSCWQEYGRTMFPAFGGLSLGVGIGLVICGLALAGLR
jgi:hypothetical protein